LIQVNMAHSHSDLICRLMGSFKEETSMRKPALVLTAAATLALSTVMEPSPAQARYWGYGGWGAGLVGGLVAGAVIGGIASSAYGYGPYGYYGGYPAYYGGYYPAYYGGYYPAYYGGYYPGYYGGYAYRRPYYGYRRVYAPRYAY
jgi:hypothetical protein